MRRAFLRLAGPFPLAGPAAWSNDWHAYRPCPYPHLHEGLDMFAQRQYMKGEPVRGTRELLPKVYAREHRQHLGYSFTVYATT